MSDHPLPGAAPIPPPPMKRYRPTDEVDFVIVGSGAAGGILARELSRGGYSVVVLEQGPWLTEKDFSHDPLNDLYHPAVRMHNQDDDDAQPQTQRRDETQVARRRWFAEYGRMVGGGTVRFGAHYWRFREIDFELATRRGIPDGSSVADWPITYKGARALLHESGLGDRSLRPLGKPVRGAAEPRVPAPATSHQVRGRAV